MNGGEVLGVDPLLLYPYYPTYVQGHDKEGRPVSYRHFGYFETWNITKVVSMKTMVAFHTWEAERLLSLTRENSKKFDCHIETFTLIVDAVDWSMRLATSDAYSFIKAMAVNDSSHYPECLGAVVVINAPMMLAFVFNNAIKPFLDEVTRKKVNIFSHREQWQPALYDLIDKDQLPIKYGGTLPNLTPVEAIHSWDPKGSHASAPSSQSHPLAGKAAEVGHAAGRGAAYAASVTSAPTSDTTHRVDRASCESALSFVTAAELSE